MRLNGQDVSRGFHLDGPPQNAIEVELESNRASGSITGIVISDKLEPVPNVTLALIPKGTGAYKNVWTDSNGRFRITQVDPGDYTLYAWEDVELYAWQNEDFMRGYAGRGKAIHVDEGAAANTQVNVIPYSPGN